MTAGVRYLFDDFEADPHARRPTRAGERVALSERHFEVLVQLLAQAGTTVSKDALVEAAWHGVAVTDNSLEQAISALRRALGPGPEGRGFIDTVPRHGYRFIGSVTRAAARASDASLDALLAPHRAWLEGRAALETLARGEIDRARQVFDDYVRRLPDDRQGHIGLANACVLQFEATRTDAAPDREALAAAELHAREACRLDDQSGEAFATLGFVLDRAGRAADAQAALRRAVALEPDNWRHHVRLAYASWGEERLRAGHRALALLPGCPLAHWMIATVLVARQRLDEAAHALTDGLAAQETPTARRFSAVGLCWLRGLIHFARGDEAAARADFEGELAGDQTHLYARECAAHTWYAIGALAWRQGRAAAARDAFAQALERVASHPMARGALAAIDHPAQMTAAVTLVSASVDAATGMAVALTIAGDPAAAARLLETALDAAPPGSAGWMVPIEPLLDVPHAPEAWAGVLSRLRARSA